MLWLLFMRFLLVASLAAWWFKKPDSYLQNLLLAIASLVTFYVVAPFHAQLCFVWSLHYSRELVWYLRLDDLVLRHANMLVTLVAVVWLLNRTWQTLWKPTSDLISILGVDVPEPPDVSLAGIRADAATLNWTRPASNRPVQKFLIQVNGVNVGESRPEETAITVTGLRPNHCYNVRVIAIGPNNFQTGSQIIRLRTYKRDGRPELGNSRLPDSFQDQDPRATQPQVVNDATGKTQVPSIEAAPSLDGAPAAAPPRESSSSAPANQRRNTLSRRHSPSVASQDQPVVKTSGKGGQTEPSLKQLADALEKTRKEIDDTLAQYQQEEADFKRMEETLRQEKEKKKQLHKEKDDQTAQLKQKVKATYEQMRQTNKEKARKESVLKDKQDKRRKMRDSVDKWNTEVGTMKKSREGFACEKESLKQDRDLKVKHLDEENSALQEEFTQLEAEYKEKKEQLKELEDERKMLPGGDEDEKWKEDDRRMRREFDMRRRELQSQLIMENRRAQQIENHIHVLHTQIYTLQQSGLQLYNQGNSSGVDFDQNASTQVKRRSRNSNTSVPAPNVSSPAGQFAGTESVFGPALNIGRSGFAPGPFIDLSTTEIPGADAPFSEADLRALTGGAPLSPTATALLPSGILMDDDPPSPTSDARRSPVGIDENDAHSPSSSGRRSMVSSPRDSSHNLPFALSNVDSNEHRSINEVTSSPRGPPQAPNYRFANLFASFNKGRGARGFDEEAPALGSLKSGQSQSFPRQLDETDPSNKRRISFSSNWFNRSTTSPGVSEGGIPQASKFSAKRLNPFASSTSNVIGEHLPSSPRPSSIASAELPRPSTDSGSIWGAPGETASHFSKSRIWSPEAMLWSSRNPSRRPSIHGSPSALKTTLASAEDEILDEEALLDPQVSPSQVGVIGSRAPIGRPTSLSQRLNPAAPTFMAGIFRPKERDTDASKDKEKSKSKDSQRSREKGKSKKEATTPSLEAPPSLDDSPLDSRASRDTYSVHTQTSVSESRESLSLERSPSDNPSGGTFSSSYKDQESAMRKLFRKGSSSKFSLSSRLGKDSGGLFATKKTGGGGPGSVTNSDKNLSFTERSSIGEVEDLAADDASFVQQLQQQYLGRSYDSVTSSPSLGPAKSKDSSLNRDGGANGARSGGGWSSRFSMKKRAKESLELERAAGEGQEGDKKDV